MLLNTLIRSALDEAGEEIDFEVVADKVVADLPGEEIDPVLRYLVRTYVTNFAGRSRRRLLNPDMAELTDAVLDSCDPPTPGPSRRETYVAVWRRVLDAIVIVEEGKPGKRLGRCGVDDVDKIAADLGRREGEIRSRRLQYEFLGNSMRAAKAKLVEDLSPAVIEAFVKGGKP